MKSILFLAVLALGMRAPAQLTTLFQGISICSEKLASEKRASIQHGGITNYQVPCDGGVTKVLSKQGEYFFEFTRIEATQTIELEIKKDGQSIYMQWFTILGIPKGIQGRAFEFADCTLEDLLKMAKLLPAP